MKPRKAKFGIGEIVKHRKYPFRGIIYDVDPVFANTDEWWLSIPEEVRPPRTSLSTISTPKMLKRNMSPMSPSRICSPTTPATLSAIPQVEDVFARADEGGYVRKTRRPLN